MKRINFEDGQLVNAGYVKEDGTIEEAVYEGSTPLSAFNMNKLQDNIEEAIGTKVVTETGLDLNNFTNDGRWFFASAYVPLNIPSGNNGWLEVFSTNTTNSIKQVWYRYGGLNSSDYQTFVRTRIGTVWSNWKQFAIVEDTGWINAVLQNGVIAHSKRWKQCSTI